MVSQELDPLPIAVAEGILTFRGGLTQFFFRFTQERVSLFFSDCYRTVLPGPLCQRAWILICEFQLPPHLGSHPVV